MTIYEKPNALVFAENAPSSEITDFTAWARGLGIAFDETNGFPQMEGFNGLLNALSGYIKYLEQNGIPPWRDDLEYPVDARVVYSGVVYRCIAQNTSSRPDLSQMSWANTVIDNLTSTSTQSGLSANQGRVLNASKISKTDIIDNLTSTEKQLPLSANQGRVLKSQITQTTSSNSMGYQGYLEFKDADGNTVMVHQWGTVDFDSYPDERQVDITFQKPFAKNCLNIQATRKMSQHSPNGDGGVHLIGTPSRNGASFSLQQFYGNSNGDLRGFTWFAVGN